ncbi:MAG TPA: glycosyltransferase family 2 protein [Candidatus Wunengus sp. YC64]|uniref:glycosyltransferase family 2 protein n=1 Tax=Candidatus Wunengus sp. YC64 TaxID=3367700 RepID=UPI004026C017
MISKLDLTIVVCSYNVENTIKDCLDSIKENNPARTILVDGGSTDKTTIIAQDYVDEIVDDQAKGLANARNIGIERSNTKYICFVGPDNIMPKGSLKEMINYLELHNCAIVSAVTILRDTGSYWGWAQNIYRIRKYTPGYKNVVGTPTLFKTDILKKYKYNPFMKNSDDTELCNRMSRDGLLFAISNTRCFEIGFDIFSSVIERWTRYGRGDYLFYCTQRNNWGILRKLKSFLHPLLHDFYVPLSRIKFTEIGCLPFLLIIVLLRYYGWLKSNICHVERKVSVHKC